jgi:ABC-type glycerol-3-phosphate transport system substrate-binding protein
MRKFKVIRKWPGGPEVGSVGEMGVASVFFIVDGYRHWHTPEELEGFVEELKEPEEFWFVTTDGMVCPSRSLLYPEDAVSKEFRFPTKEHAQAFADGMRSTTRESKDNTQWLKFISALNSRKHGG